MPEARASSLRAEPELAPVTHPSHGRPRRTVTIRGQVAPPRLVEVDRRRPPRRPHERVGSRPDRVAMWAVLLGVFLVLIAATSAQAASAARYRHVELGARTVKPSMAGDHVRTMQDPHERRPLARLR